MTSSASQTNTTAGIDPRLAELAEDLAIRLRAGEQVDLEAYLNEHPAQAEGLRRLLPAIAMMADLGQSAVRELGGAPPGLGDPGAALGTLGDYRIVREVGRGGMGVVYEARQVSLNRRVALKVLPFAATIDPRQLQRFQNEAQAAAGLHHTHIVPVFAVGCERGVHYYAMQFIEGQSLAEVIGQLRELNGTGPMGRLTAGAAAGEPATAPAPENTEPSVHRAGQSALPSLRPSDVPEMETPKTEPTSPATAGLSSGSSITSRSFFQTVARLGIQAAEALEYAHALGVVHRDIKPANLLLDPRGDLWVTDFGLARLHADAGLTMTGDVLGTLRYMSPEQALANRSVIDHRSDIYSLGATMYELLTLRPAVEGRDRQEILRGIAFEEPRPLRRLNRAVPGELETIVLKAIAKEPTDRYAKAQELAEDLRRFLENKPIRARRPGPAERAAKWAQRHRTIVAATMILLAMALVGLAIASVLLARKQVEVTRQRDMARASAIRADARGQLARNAVDTMYTRVAEEWLAGRPRLEPLQREFLEEALGFYEEFARDQGSDPVAREGVAEANRRAGEIRSRLGQLREAESAYRRALAIGEGLAAEYPAKSQYRYQAAEGWRKLGGILVSLGRRDEAETAYRRTLTLAEGLSAPPIDRPEYRWVFARGHHDLGLLCSGVGRYAEAEAAYRHALPIYETLARDHPDRPEFRLSLANGLNNMANLLKDTGSPKGAEDGYRRAILILGPTVDRYPTRPVYRERLAFIRNNLGVILWQSGSQPGAEEAFRHALTDQETLVADFPDVPDYRDELSNSHNSLGVVLRSFGKTADAEKEYRRAIALAEKLVEGSPGVTDYRSHLAYSLNSLGNLLVQMGRFADADVSYRRALGLLGKLSSESPANPEYRAALVQGRAGLGDSLRSTAQWREATNCYDQALDLVTAFVADFPGRGGHVERWTFGTLNNLARILANCPNFQVLDPPRAVRLAERAVELRPKDWSGWNTLGVARYRAGDWAAATKALETSMSLRSGGDAYDWLVLAMARRQIGDKEHARVWYDKAVASMEVKKQKDEELLRFRAEAATLLQLGDFDAMMPNGAAAFAR